MVKNTKETLEEVLNNIESYINDRMFYTGYREPNGVVNVDELSDYLNDIRKENGIEVNEED